MYFSQPSAKTPNKSNMYLLPAGYTPTERDILCGRGKANLRWAGNKAFMDLIRGSLKEYTDAKTRILKSVVVTTVTNRIFDSGLRFLKFDADQKVYEALNADRSYEKTGHAIRDVLKNIKKKEKKRTASSASKDMMKKTKSQKGQEDSNKRISSSSFISSEEESTTSSSDENEPMDVVATTAASHLDEKRPLSISPHFQSPTISMENGLFSLFSANVPLLNTFVGGDDEEGNEKIGTEFHDRRRVTSIGEIVASKSSNTDSQPLTVDSSDLYDAPLPIDSKPDFEGDDIEKLSYVLHSSYLGDEPWIPSLSDEEIAKL